MRASISAKILGILISVSVGVFAVLALNNISRIRDHLEADFLTSAVIAARTLDATVTSMADIDNDSQLSLTIQKAIWLNPDILRIDVSLPINGILTTTVSSDPTNVGRPASAAGIRSLDDDLLLHTFDSTGEAKTLLLTIPIHVARKQRGIFEVEFTLEVIEEKIIGSIILELFLFAFIIITISMVLFVFIKIIIIRRLERLRNSVRELGLVGSMPGLDLRGRDEIGDLSRGINQMAADLAETQDKLRQSQKLEALGQLTGGIAHDFNNLLAVILGNAELLECRLGGHDRSTQSILRAAMRGAELTQRLLAFSRRQPLHPRVVDLGQMVEGMTDMLQRTLGETIDIETSRAEGLWPAQADPGEVENALLNLTINARNAMPEGGKLFIETTNATLGESYAARHIGVRPGDYVLLAISDSGEGMTPEVVEHAFEPFFTTRDVGEGSGLGLSMVYGFAKQSDGEVAIYSEPGHGTTVKLYLPRAASAARSEEANQGEDLPQGRGEAVLVIEDDPDVCALAVETLEGLGYRVIDVPAAAVARDVLKQGEKVDLVLSDVVLPGGTSGPEFAEEARARDPDIKIIFMSGYSTEAAKHSGFPGSDKVLLNKPFQRQQLATALREALDRDFTE